MKLRWGIVIAGVFSGDCGCTKNSASILIVDRVDGGPNWDKIKKNFDQLTSRFSAKGLTFEAVPATQTSFDPAEVKNHFARARAAFTYPFASQQHQPPSGPEDYRPLPWNPLTAAPFLGGINDNFDTLVRALDDYQVIGIPDLMDAYPPPGGSLQWKALRGSFEDMKTKFAQKNLPLDVSPLGSAGATNAMFNKVAAAFTPKLVLEDVSSGGLTWKKSVIGNFQKIKKAYDDFREVLSFNPQSGGQGVNWLNVRNNFDQMTRVLPQKGLAFPAVLRREVIAAPEGQKYFQKASEVLNVHLARVDTGSAQARIQAVNANFEKIKKAWDAYKATRSYYEWTWYQDEIDSDDFCNEED